jgi:hypothetical protein
MRVLALALGLLVGVCRDADQQPQRECKYTHRRPLIRYDPPNLAWKLSHSRAVVAIVTKI